MQEQLAGLAERLALGAACDLVERFAEARGEVFFLDKACDQVGAGVRFVRLEQAGRVLPDFAA